MRRIALLAVFALPLLAGGEDLVQFVNPFIGTGAGAPDYALGNSAGNTPPGAAFPFGMVLWSPDTTNLAGGYRYNQSRIGGFSLTHISGRGIGCYQDIPILPIAGALTASPGNSWASYAVPFRHQNEAASPGYYRVGLDNGVNAELTVTRRTGIARLSFDESPLGTVLINVGGSAQPNRDRGTGVRIDGPGQISGSTVSGDCGGWFKYQVFFAAEFDRPFRESGVWNGGSLLPGATEASGAATGAYAVFDTGSNSVVQLKVALSYVSVEQARLNLAAENPGWEIAAIRQSAGDAWNARLNSIVVSGGSRDELTVFYTALYHAFIHPSTFGDHNGKYLGFDNRVHDAAGRGQYHNFSSWDMYRSQIPLIALLAPETGDMMQSLVNDAAQDSGGGLPRWAHANTNSGGMLGDGPSAIIATAHAFGATHFDVWSALTAMEKGALDPNTTSGGVKVRTALTEFLQLGYVPTSQSVSGSRTLEYTTDDFAISRFVLALGDAAKAGYYLRRAQNWKNLVHEGYLVPRHTDGTFVAYDQPWNGLDFAEGSIAQYSWMVPFNMRGLIDRTGGNAAAVARLDTHFTEFNAGPWSEFSFMGNEPSLKTPWVYAFAGAPWRTQDVVRRAAVQLFRNSPDGLPGNDDLGTLSSWYVFASIGLYPHIPGVGGFVVGSPMFTSVQIHLANGNTIRIDAPAASAATPFVQSLKVNGKEHNSAWIPWDALKSGGTLEFALSGVPNREWGADPAQAPPSFDLE